MVQQRSIGELRLDGDGLHTPDGVMPIASITRAELVRSFSRTSETTVGSDPAAVAGGAVLGGVVAGPVGMLAGGLLGSTVKEERTEPGVPRTTSVTLVFESPELAYSVTYGRDRLVEAEGFVRAVKDAAGL